MRSVLETHAARLCETLRDADWHRDTGHPTGKKDTLGVFRQTETTHIDGAGNSEFHATKGLQHKCRSQSCGNSQTERQTRALEFWDTLFFLTKRPALMVVSVVSDEHVLGSLRSVYDDPVSSIRRTCGSDFYRVGFFSRNTPPWCHFCFLSKRLQDRALGRVISRA